MQGTGGEPTRLSDGLLKEAQPDLTSYSAARSSIHSGVWTEAMQAEFDRLEAAETFAEISEDPAGRIFGVKVALEGEGRRAWHG